MRWYRSGSATGSQPRPPLHACPAEWHGPASERPAAPPLPVQRFSCCSASHFPAYAAAPPTLPLKPPPPPPPPNPAALPGRGATPRDMRVLPKRIFLVRHAESEGNVDNMCAALCTLCCAALCHAVLPRAAARPSRPCPPRLPGGPAWRHLRPRTRRAPPSRPRSHRAAARPAAGQRQRHAWGASLRNLKRPIFHLKSLPFLFVSVLSCSAYTYLPDPRVPLTARGWQQAMLAGDRLKAQMDAAHGGKPYKLFFYTSPYLRSRQVGPPGRAVSAAARRRRGAPSIQLPLLCRGEVEQRRRCGGARGGALAALGCAAGMALGRCPARHTHAHVPAHTHTHTPASHLAAAAPPAAASPSRRRTRAWRRCSCRSRCRGCRRRCSCGSRTLATSRCAWVCVCLCGGGGTCVCVCACACASVLVAGRCRWGQGVAPAQRGSRDGPSRCRAALPAPPPRLPCRARALPPHLALPPPPMPPLPAVVLPPQDAEGKKREKAERLRFGRFFYRFPNGESGADVYYRWGLVWRVVYGVWRGVTRCGAGDGAFGPVPPAWPARRPPGRTPRAFSVATCSCLASAHARTPPRPLSSLLSSSPCPLSSPQDDHL